MWTAVVSPRTLRKPRPLLKWNPLQQSPTEEISGYDQPDEQIFCKNCQTFTTIERDFKYKKAWIWGPHQQESFEKVKAEIATPQVLAHYDVTAETKVCADASSYGLGAVLLQKQGELWKPVAFASRALHK